MDDFGLLERWRAGDVACGSTLVRRHADALLMFFANKVAADADVDDLVQTTMLVCVDARDRLWEGASFRAFALGVARRVLFRYFRTQRRELARFEPLQSSVEDVRPGASSQLAEADEEQRLNKALLMIPVDFQITLELLYWHELSTEQVAGALGIAPATVRTRLLRAKAHLQRALSKLERGAA